MIKSFIDSVAKEYPAVEVKGKPGAPFPILYWVGKHNNIVRTAHTFKGRAEDMAFITDLLQSQGIEKGVEPVFVEEPFAHTSYCKAWRVMSLEGERGFFYFPMDRACTSAVDTPHRGKCICIDDTEIEVAYTPNKVRDPFTCEEKCKLSGVEPVELEGDNDNIIEEEL